MRNALLRSSVLLALASAGCVGVGSGELETGAPRLAARLELDQPAYRVGHAVVAKLTLINQGEEPVSVARPGPATVEFFARDGSGGEPRHVEMVAWEQETVEFLKLAGAGEHERFFVLPRLTAEPGALELFATYRSEGTRELGVAVTTEPVAVQIGLPVALQRDGTGLIVAEEAERIAREHFGRPAAGVDARLVRDERMRLPLWWVTVHFVEPTADGARSGSAFVDPYRAVVRAETDREVQLEPPPDARPVP